MHATSLLKIPVSQNIHSMRQGAKSRGVRCNYI